MLTTLLVLLLIFGVLDFFDDTKDGVNWLQLSVDLLFGGLILGTIAYLWKYTPFSTRQFNAMLNQEIEVKHQHAEAWKKKSADLLSGLSKAIDEQLNDWGLTGAEKEVGLLLLKGYSLKDIALLRDTTERTVRQQASSIYSKSGLANRAELSAFFLEDFLAPVVP